MNRHGIWGKLTDLPKAGASWEAGEWGAVQFQTFPLLHQKSAFATVHLVMFSYTILVTFAPLIHMSEAGLVPLSSHTLM